MSTGKLRVRSFWKSNPMNEAGWVLVLSAIAGGVLSGAGTFGALFKVGTFDVGESFPDTGASFSSGSIEDLSPT